MSIGFRPRAESLASALPPFLAAAEALAATITLGDHGRRQSGMGETFWQFRAAQAGDPLRRIDWRRSARGDQAFVRETEWEAAQTLTLWVDDSLSMQFATGGESKLDRAKVLALAISILLLRGGERVGVMPQAVPARAGRLQIERVVEGLLPQSQHDYGTPPTEGYASRGRALLISDFFGSTAALEQSLARAADSGVKGVLLQILDPSEEEFPFDGRTIFESMSGTLAHETLEAGALRARYLQRLAERKTQLETLARNAGWHYHCHHTGQSAQSALLWLYRALERNA